MNKAELIKQLRKAHEKQLFDDEAVERVLDEYAQQEARKAWFEASMGSNQENENKLFDKWWLKQQEEQ